ncbi:uncharacterized protein RCO7_08257 [Rhynchosporium graminicola]|uniref:DUF7924 domain-containing protein n=1 Tax=Rhynchosporium graminicola TaxID=2792576 RepID=A0A1E1LCS1_9HELO|nr:uncharacterized protein RCO7_08257 [Rhynchosporium commune]
MGPQRSSARARSRRSESKSSRNSPATSSKASARTSAYDRNFEQHLIDHQIYPNNRAAKPDNWADINLRMTQPRASLSPSKLSEEAFEKFQKISESALTEAKVMNTAFPIILGSDATDIPSEQSLLFNNLKSLTDETVVDAKPDFYDGSELEKIHPEIRESLSSTIIPPTLRHAPCPPNFFMKAKGPDGSAAVAKRQACYDGAFGARAMTSMRQYRQPPILDHKALSITTTFHDSCLRLYTTHITDLGSEDGPRYHMTQLRSFAMTDTVETFREGASALRNARDWAMEQREQVISTANMAVGMDDSRTSASKSAFEGDASTEGGPQPSKGRNLAAPNQSAQP